MLTFIPSWQTPSYEGASHDDLVNQIRAYEETGEAYQVIIHDYIPSLLYFLHRYDLLECPYQSVYEVLQESAHFEQRQVKVETLFSPAVSYHFTPSCMLVQAGEEEIGQIYFGEGASLQEVRYLEKGHYTRIDTYDARGFLSRYQEFSKGKAGSFFYLDVSGEWIFEERPDGSCRVNPKNHKGLVKKNYPSREVLEWACVSLLLEKHNSEPLLIGADEGALSWLEDYQEASKVTLSLFKERYPYSPAHMEKLSALSLRVQAMLVDEEDAFSKLSSFVARPSSLTLLSSYDTRFRLSKSQEYAKEVLYIDMRKTSMKKSQFMMEQLLSYSAQSFIEKGRVLQLVFRVNHLSHKQEIEHQIMGQLRKDHGSALDELSFYNKMKESGENALGEILEAGLSAEAKWLEGFQEDMEVVVLHHDDEFFKWMHLVRLVIDLGSRPDVFTQMAALSAGVPQLNSTKSPYVTPMKNGRLVLSQEDFQEALAYYLDSLKHWQEARVYSVQQLKHHSGRALQEKIATIVGEERRGR